MSNRKILKLVTAVLLLVSMLTLTSCNGVLLPGIIVGGSSNENGNGEDYVTREELESLLGDSDDETPSAPGDEYEITINSNDQTNLLAASKALLSVVSVYCNFQTSYTTGFGPNANVTTKDYSSAGSGVIYKLDKASGDAYIVTNYHVVYDSNANTKNHISADISVYLYGQEVKDYKIPAVYVGGSMQYDLAVLKVTGSSVLKASNAIAATIANSDEVSVLETAIVIGNPGADGISATVGSINVDSEYITMPAADDKTTVKMRVIRTDAAVNSGNSGGGMFNAGGDLIGIINAKMASSTIDNIGYAIPSNIVKYIAENILYYCDGTDEECVYRCLFGITVEANESYTVYDTETGKVHRMERVALSVVDEGIASGKLLVGDVINTVTIDGAVYEVTRVHGVIDSMLNARVGSSVKFNIERNGVEMDVEFTVTEECLVAYK